MKANRILYVSQEIVPFTTSTPMAENCRHLPQAIMERGHEIRTFMPKWGSINERRNQLHEVIRLSGMNLIIDDTDHPLVIKVASLQQARMQVYFIDNDDYFHISHDDPALSGPSMEENDERVIFFARGVLETVKKLRWNADLIHLHGWIGALVALYAKVLFADEPAFRDAKVVLSLYDKAFASLFRPDFFTRLRTKNMPDFDVDGVATPVGYEELMRLAIKYSDGVIIDGDEVSPALIEFAAQQGKPVMPKTAAENYFDACNEFYETVMSNEQ